MTRLHAACFAAALAAAPLHADWTRFRGPGGTGIAEGPPAPAEWSADTNLKWKAELPGLGSSSPVVAAGRVYVTAYTGYGQEPGRLGDAAQLTRHLLAYDRRIGEELWRHSEAAPEPDAEDPYQGFITQHGYASSTPAADAERVYALLGKSGLFALTHDGELAWRVELGGRSDPAKWGDGSSPALIGGSLVVNAGILGHALVGLDPETGEEAWRVEDEAFTNAWSTPVPVEAGGRTLAVFAVPKQVVAVDAETGEVAWKADHEIADSTASSLVASSGEGGTVLSLMGGREGFATAWRVPTSGGEPQELWRGRLRSGIGTPVAVDGVLYWPSGGVLHAARLSDGGLVFKERLPRFDGGGGGFGSMDYSSPVVSGGRILFVSRGGEGYALRPGESLDVAAHNRPFEGDASSFNATPAVSDGDLFLRSEKFLYCLGRVNRDGPSPVVDVP